MFVTSAHAGRKEDGEWRIVWHGNRDPDPVPNVDGNYNDSGRSGFGGVLRNKTSVWMSGFTGNLGFSECLHAELMTIFKGLEFAWSKGIRKFTCFM